MVLVPPGCFMLGSDSNPVGGQTSPANKQCFDKPFWIDMLEVSNKQFKDLGGQAMGPANWLADQRPREEIAWSEAAAFCEKRGARLPTEAEWEYAARGPDGLEYPWGNRFVADNVVYASNANYQSADVGSRPGGKSWVGAYDLSGNVWEWTSSLLRPYPYNRADGRESMADTGEMRTLRGGSWTLDSIGVRAVGRNVVYPTAGRSSDGGFRCARAFDEGAN
jgi:formylglycine-generating enzyme required for sulfatase activity